MILAWCISLLLLCTSFITYLEHYIALRLRIVATMQISQEQFMAAEKSVLECEKSISPIFVLTENNCIIQLLGKNIWLISSKGKPIIQVHVLLDEKSGSITRLNWRQAYE